MNRKSIGLGAALLLCPYSPVIKPLLCLLHTLACFYHLGGNGYWRGADDVVSHVHTESAAVGTGALAIKSSTMRRPGFRAAPPRGSTSS